MRENIFEPLGMKDTMFGKPKDAERLTRMATLYRFDENLKPKKEPQENPYIISSEYQSGGAGLVSGTEDYALFLDAMANGGVGASGARILSETTVKLMYENQLNDVQLENFRMGFNKRGYGYGLGVRTLMNRAQAGALSPVGEFGWNGAASAYALADPVNKLSVTFFTHVLNGQNGFVQPRLRNIVYSCLEK